jgi:hypothetical protein
MPFRSFFPLAALVLDLIGGATEKLATAVPDVV